MDNNENKEKPAGITGSVLPGKGEEFAHHQEYALTKDQFKAFFYQGYIIIPGLFSGAGEIAKIINDYAYPKANQKQYPGKCSTVDVALDISPELLNKVSIILMLR